MYQYVFKPQAVEDFKKLPKDIQKKIIKKLDYYLSTDDPLAFADSLINFSIGQYRFRIGDDRVIFDLEDSKIVILTLGHRKQIYR